MLFVSVLRPEHRIRNHTLQPYHVSPGSNPQLGVAVNLLGTVNVFEAVKALCADGASKLKDAERSLQLDCLEVVSGKYVYSMLTCMNLYHVICFVIYLYIILTLCVYIYIYNNMDIYGVRKTKKLMTKVHLFMLHSEFSPFG